MYQVSLKPLRKLIPLLGLFIFFLAGTFDVQAQTALYGKDKDKKEKGAPVVRNPRFSDGILIVDAGGSNIDMGSAQLRVNDSESFPLNIDDSGTCFRVGRERTSSPSGIKIGDAIPPGRTVSLIIVNPDGSRSEPVSFSR